MSVSAWWSNVRCRHCPAEADAQPNILIPFSRQLRPESPQLQWRRRQAWEKTALHWGQRKLFVSELEFLTQYAAAADPDHPDSPPPPQLVVYIGAAPGQHLDFLGELFPQVRWLLIDPEPFLCRTDGPVRVLRAMFTDDLARELRRLCCGSPAAGCCQEVVPKAGKGPSDGEEKQPSSEAGEPAESSAAADAVPRSPCLESLRRLLEGFWPPPARSHGEGGESQASLSETSAETQLTAAAAGAHHNQILFVSDIRTANPIGMSDEEHEFRVAKDMRDQHRWLELLRPRAALLKFRLPYTPGITEYADGEVRLPVWGRQSTTECRLVVDGRRDCRPLEGATEDGGFRIRAWDHLGYGNQLFYFNSRTRTLRYGHPIPGAGRTGLCHCYDCAAEVAAFRDFLLSGHGRSLPAAAAAISEDFLAYLEADPQPENWDRDARGEPVPRNCLVEIPAPLRPQIAWLSAELSSRLSPQRKRTLIHHVNFWGHAANLRNHRMESLRAQLPEFRAEALNEAPPAEDDDPKSPSAAMPPLEFGRPSRSRKRRKYVH